MTKQLAFLIFLAAALGLFTYTCLRLRAFFGLTKKSFPVNRIGERIRLTLLVAFGQTKILRRPGVGLLHALVWWGFIVITLGTAEMTLDGILGTERILAPFTGPLYDVLVASGDVFAAIIIVACLAFLARRHIMKVKRFSGIEMKPKSSADATIALTLILLLMVSLIGMNMGYVKLSCDGIPESACLIRPYHGSYPVSEALLPFIGSLDEGSTNLFYEASWWTHIALVFIFLNVLPYSKHFHVIMSVPNVFLSRLEPLTKIRNMDSVTREVRAMLDPSTGPAPADPASTGSAGGETAAVPRFGVKDIEDVSWKNYADALTCTECGRCTSVCPANITGKLLSPRKILVDTRRRMNDKGPGMVKNREFTDGKSLVGDYITREELWACTTCNACVMECPVNIDHVSLIVDMRRSLVMEESSAPEALLSMFSNIENNGAPWQYAQADRMGWAEGVEVKERE